ncbi:glutathione S-transferase N-terminal domain-containing protein [Azospirillum sp. YIM B02556]|uniref:Glutathione S-transferase N-terminal domain-containing protein n=1 Tax=Azospirillum endophyticum TaxID=2800326 RepID=A0ABS1F0I2_9PROT|nr:glutathione S-transferase N-terminal domain-containing protein [Azospirillum endophyticum]MBK1836930.1 glutathione S-transferase N-terminal domain-containing protein [Azospirillum endophyticum]
MPTLYGMPSTASMAPHILLREIGRPFDLVLLDREKGEHKSAGYLALNPHGRVPTLVDGNRDDGLVLYESAAICLHLADSHPEAKLAPAIGTPERAAFYKWLVYLTNSVQAEMLLYFYPERYVEGAEAQAAFKAATEARLNGHFDGLDRAMAGRRWLLGDTYSAVDPYLFMLCRWTRFMGRPARKLGNLGPYLARVLERPAVKAVFEAEGLAAPYC